MRSETGRKYDRDPDLPAGGEDHPQGWAQLRRAAGGTRPRALPSGDAVPAPVRAARPGPAQAGERPRRGADPAAVRPRGRGRPAGLPRRLTGRWAFPPGSRYCYAMLHIDFEFPRPGRYRLDITD